MRRCGPTRPARRSPPDRIDLRPRRRRLWRTLRRAPAPHPTPGRAPDLSLDFVTRADQALIYRLNGDRNPLHADPRIARQAGFDRPILHGLCTYGITCRAILQAITGFDPEPILSHQVRFSAPVIPGDTLTVDLWRDGKEIAFEARVKARAVTVIKNGLTVLR